MTCDMPRPRAIVLLSGGVDSATALAVARAEGFTPYALSFRYGQRHEQELTAAGRVARRRAWRSTSSSTSTSAGSAPRP